jgi:hypothetical protein
VNCLWLVEMERQAEEFYTSVMAGTSSDQLDGVLYTLNAHLKKESAPSASSTLVAYSVYKQLIPNGGLVRVDHVKREEVSSDGDV